MSMVSPKNEIERAIWDGAILAAVKLVQARAAKWTEAAKADTHSNCADSLSDECDDIAAAIKALSS